MVIHVEAPPGLVSDKLPDFIERWGVDEQSQQFLTDLPIDVQEEVISSFDPPPGTRSVDAKLHAFARRVAVEMGHPELGSRANGPQNSGLATMPGPPQNGSEVLAETGDALSDFIARWGLDETSELMLRSQSPGLVDDVITNFAPDPNTRNVNAKLFAFVKAKQAASPGSAGPGGSQSASRFPDETIQQFAVTWALDDTAIQMLKKLPPDVCASVLTDFNPPADTQNVNAKLNAFVRGRLEKVGMPFPNLSMGAVAASAAPAASSASYFGRGAGKQDPVRSFVDKWGCDSQNEAMLRQLQPEHLTVVIRDFDPPPGTYNVNGKLSSFIRSVVSRNSFVSASVDPTETFAVHWGLDAEALQTLRNLPESLQNRVMAEFDPPPGTLNVSGKLSAFIRGKVATSGDGGDWGAQPREAPAFGRGGKVATSDDAGDWAVQTADALDSEQLLADFNAQWRLDAEALHLLRSLPEDVMIGVIQDFQPRSDTWNPSGKLHAFVRARLKELGMESTVAASATAPRNSARAVEPPAGARGDDVDDFVAHWGLDRSSEELLRVLPEDVRAHVLSSFEPQPNTRNRNAKLATWVRSLQTQSVGGDVKRQRLL